MAKPTVLPRWANVGGSVATPAAGKLDVGWLSGEKPAAQYANWIHLNSYNWFAWLDGLFNATDTLTLPVNQHVIVSGTGRHKHGTMTMAINAAAMQAGGSAAVLTRSVNGISNAAAAAANFVLGVQLPIGCRILAVRAYLRDNVTGPSTVALLLKKVVNATNTVSTPATSATSAGTGAYQTLTTGAVAETITSGNSYEIEINAIAGTNVIQVHQIEIDYDLP